MSSTTELDELKKIALKFANDCGEQALGERDYEKIKQLYVDFAKDVRHLLIKAKIEALEKARTEQGGHNLEELCCDMCDDIDALTSQLGDTK